MLVVPTARMQSRCRLVRDPLGPDDCNGDLVSARHVDRFDAAHPIRDRVLMEDVEARMPCACGLYDGITSTTDFTTAHQPYLCCVEPGCLESWLRSMGQHGFDATRTERTIGSYGIRRAPRRAMIRRGSTSHGLNSCRGDRPRQAVTQQRSCSVCAVSTRSSEVVHE
jgi:hypothetical protein